MYDLWIYDGVMYIGYEYMMDIMQCFDGHNADFLVQENVCNPFTTITCQDSMSNVSELRRAPVFPRE